MSINGVFFKAIMSLFEDSIIPQLAKVRKIA